MKIAWIVLFILIIAGCGSNDKFKKQFKDCLSEEHVELILKINSDYDSFILSKFPSAAGDLEVAYSLLTEKFFTEEAFEGYSLPNSQIESIKKQLIKTGLYSELYDSEANEINFTGQYIKCLSTSAEKDKHFASIYSTINVSGSRYSLIMAFNVLQYLSNNNEINSAAKKVVIFEIVVGEIERITTANKS